MEGKVRVDKWLWSVRIFKSRSMATAACKSGKVRINQKTSKASSLVEIGNLVEVKKNGFDLTFKIKKLISKRVSAVLAQPCYTDLTPQSEKDKFKNWFVGKASGEFRERGVGRPTKRDRRDIEEFKDEQIWDWSQFDDEESEN